MGQTFKEVPLRCCGRFSGFQTLSKLHVHEVAPRDGLQAETQVLPTGSKLRLVELLARSQPDSIEVTAFVRPDMVASLADADALAEAVAAAPWRGEIPLAGLVLNRRGLGRFLATDLEILTIPVSATEGHSRANSGMGMAEALEEAVDVVKDARAAGRKVRGVVSMALQCPFDGVADPLRVEEIAQAFLGEGAERVVLADTLGNARADEVARLLDHLGGGVAPERLGLHLHDNEGLAGDSVRAAWERGVRHFDSAAGGGGGCPFAPGAGGNLSTSVLVGLARDLGASCGVKEGPLRVAESFLAEALGPTMADDA